MSTAPELCNWIGGKRVPGPALIQDLRPATGDVLCRIPASDDATVDAAVKAAKAALTGPWADWSVAERADLLDAIADEIEARIEELAELESADQGKPVSLARRIDIPRAVSNFRFFAGAIRHQESQATTLPGALNYTWKSPVGVCALITPWNLPLYLLSWKTAPALAMGNTIVAKPSELTPVTADRLGEIINGLAPAGVFNVVHGRGPEAGQALLEHPDVAAISFTGGTATGKIVARTAASQFKKMSLELGGKNPTVVFDDADFELAVEGAVRAGFTNQGEICLCGSRLFVQRGIFERFQSAFLERVAALRVGNPAEDVDMGPLNSHAHRDKVESYLRLAVEEGGTVHGGSRPVLPSPYDAGAFLEPAVITGLSAECRTAQEEIFGPVVTLHAFDTEEQALALANGTRYGLSASIWTQDVGKAHRFSQALDTGMVWVNTWLMRDLRVPFGGTKQSGVGREGGRLSLDFFSESKNICIKY